MKYDKDILIGKWVSGEITPQEEQWLMDWAEKNAANRQELDAARKVWESALSIKSNRAPDVEEAWNDFQRRIATHGIAAPKHSRLWAYAAALAVLVTLGFLMRNVIFPEPVIMPISAVPNQVDTEQVIEELPDTFRMPAAIAPTEAENSALRERKRSSMIAVIAGDTALRFTLPDNSVVYLNKNSKLTYPEKFRGSERVVHLSGEAFFEVVKNKGEFIVICQDTRTRVLGTSFNVRGYQPNNDVEVTVVTGLVEVTNQAGKNSGKQLLLKPGEQAVFNSVDNSALRAKNAKKVSWWKKNKFRTKIQQFFNKIINKKEN
jgi:ferric-dicitrate binding protein FerR (iron transport regulator)